MVTATASRTNNNGLELDTPALEDWGVQLQLRHSAAPNRVSATIDNLDLSKHPVSGCCIGRNLPPTEDLQNREEEPSEHTLPAVLSTCRPRITGRGNTAAQRHPVDKSI
ncbi:hypothetical protein CRENBAI_005281 [Crenichthys baileyi]|uniref:Uncharacterized protein n=1 Tax=Crenichthys baileyi TaxID=28760 RepID=A0AAV9QMN7_9TELE